MGIHWEIASVRLPNLIASDSLWLAWRDEAVESGPHRARVRIGNLNVTRERLRRNIGHPDPKPALHSVAIEDRVGLAGRSVEAEPGRSVSSAEGFYFQIARTIARIGAAQKFLRIRHAIAIGIAGSAVVGGRASRIKSVGEFPGVGQAIAIRVEWLRAGVRASGSRGCRAPVDLVIAVAVAVDALQGQAGGVRVRWPGKSVRVGHLVHENVRNKTRVRAGGGLRRGRVWGVWGAAGGVLGTTPRGHNFCCCVTASPFAAARWRV